MYSVTFPGQPAANGGVMSGQVEAGMMTSLPLRSAIQPQHASASSCSLAERALHAVATLYIQIDLHVPSELSDIAKK